MLGDSDVLEIVGDRAEASLEEGDVETSLEEFGGRPPTGNEVRGAVIAADEPGSARLS